MSSKPPAFKQTTTHVALPEQSLKNGKRMKQVSAHALIYHGIAIIYSVWVRAYLGNYKMATAKSRTLHVELQPQFSEFGPRASHVGLKPPFVASEAPSVCVCGVKSTE